MKTIKWALVALLVSIGGISFTNAAFAQEFTEGHLEAAKRAIVATRSSNRLDNILPQIAEQAKAELIANRPDKESEITTIVDEAAISLAGRRGDLETEVIQIFARVFTEDELNAIGAFYESDAGQKFLTETPVVLREIDRASQVWSNGLNRDLGASIREKMQAAGLQ